MSDNFRRDFIFSFRTSFNNPFLCLLYSILLLYSLYLYISLLGDGLKNTWSCENKSIFRYNQQPNIKPRPPTPTRSSNSTICPQIVETSNSNRSNMRPIYYPETSPLYKNTNGSYNPSQLVYQSASTNYYPSTNFNNYNYNYNYARPNTQYDYRTTGIYNGTNYNYNYNYARPNSQYDYRATGTYNGSTMPYYHNSTSYANVSSTVSNQSSVSNNNLVVGHNGLNHSATSGRSN